MTHEEIECGGTRLRALLAWPGYWAGDDGHIYSTKRNYPQRLKPILVRRQPRAKPFVAVTVYSDLIRYPASHKRAGWKRPTPVLTHLLVASVWLPPRPGPGYEIDHKNGDRTDNRPTNLEWVTKTENTQRYYRSNPLAHRGEANPAARLSDERVRAVRALQGVMTQRMVADLFGVSTCTVSSIWLRKTWKHISEAP